MGNELPDFAFRNPVFAVAFTQVLSRSNTKLGKGDARYGALTTLRDSESFPFHMGRARPHMHKIANTHAHISAAGKDLMHMHTPAHKRQLEPAITSIVREMQYPP